MIINKEEFMKRFVITCILGLFFVSLVCSPGIAQTSEEILAKMIDAQGGKANLEKIKDTTMSGTMEMISMGMSGSITMYLKEPNMMRMDIEIMGMVVTQAFDGENAWGIDPNSGSAFDVPEDQAKDLKRMAMGYDSLLNPEKYGITFTYKGKETVEGKDYFLLEQAFEDGFTSTMYVDAETYLVFKSKQKAQNQMGIEVDQEAFSTDYRKVDGLTVPFEMKILQDGEEFISMTFTEITFNTGLEDSLFKKE
jgi:outer membrane lipoprotein-sorting protein